MINRSHRKFLTRSGFNVLGSGFFTLTRGGAVIIISQQRSIDIP